MAENDNEWQRANALNVARTARYSMPLRAESPCYSMSFTITPPNQSSNFVGKADTAKKLTANS